ncbi:MAG: imidazole glycerol phosphate synthase subunit HisH [Acidobacteria bacterium]|nr:imidazole glycerol phosphate synthase subunit HisH [Acidobacteriota bacterium]
MIALVDYGAGNLTSVRKALSALGAEYQTPATPEACAGMTGLIVPGVGHFDATRALDDRWRAALVDAVRAGTPLLGICVGMQWLFEGSAEAPDVPGIGLLPGRCERLHGDGARRLKVPHVGWNSLDAPPAPARTHQGSTSRLMNGLAGGSQVYFTHSFAAPVTEDCVAATTHVDTFAAAVERDLVFGVQFHPEKSSDVGLHMLGNFLAVCAGGR